MVTYRMGQTAGLPIGGFLAHPERHWRRTFDTEFWRTYPFALPCFVGAGFTFFAVICGLLFIREVNSLVISSCNFLLIVHFHMYLQTLPSKVSKVTVHADEMTEERKKNPLPLTSVLTRDITALLFSNLVMCLANEMLFAVYPLFAFTPIESGM